MGLRENHTIPIPSPFSKEKAKRKAELHQRYREMRLKNLGLKQEPAKDKRQ